MFHFLLNLTIHKNMHTHSGTVTFGLIGSKDPNNYEKESFKEYLHNGYFLLHTCLNSKA